MGRDEDIHQCQYHNTMRGLLRWWRDKTLIVGKIKILHRL